jgi:putative transcriptional regulator
MTHSPAMQSLRECLIDLSAIGVMRASALLRKIDAIPPHLSPKDIRQLRQQTGMSQSEFARALNVSTIIVSRWERGVIQPSGPSFKLLDLVSRKGVEILD